jgi:hypothetical protein
MQMTSTISTAHTKTSSLKYTGRLQHSVSRVPEIPDVDYSKGGSDFRCPQNTSSFGRQVLGWKHTNTASKAPFAECPRFGSSATVGPGPAKLGQYSSMKKQTISNRRSAASMSFGTSSRDDALKQYNVFTYKKT